MRSVSDSVPADHLVTPRRARRFHEILIGWAESHGRSFPWRQARDPYAVLIGEVLLQRTRGPNIPAVYESFLARWPTPCSLSQADVDDIAETIAPLGLRKRADTLRRLGAALHDLGVVPTAPADLIDLPGVGPYGAHAVPIMALEADLPLVDWVIARVLRRYFGLAGGRRPNADRELWALAERLAHFGNARPLWLAVLDFADGICRPRPRCDACVLRRGCVAYRSGTIVNSR